MKGVMCDIRCIFNTTKVKSFWDMICDQICHQQALNPTIAKQSLLSPFIELNGRVEGHSERPFERLCKVVCVNKCILSSLEGACSLV